MADAEFDVGIDLDHSGRYNGSDKSDDGGAAVAHEGFGLFAEVEIEETQDTSRQEEREGPDAGNFFKVESKREVNFF